MIRFVLAAMEAPMTSGADSTERVGMKWDSDIQTASRPSASAMRAQPVSSTRELIPQKPMFLARSITSGPVSSATQSSAERSQIS